MRVPVVRHLLACERVERLSGGRHLTLHRLIWKRSPKDSEEYPKVSIDLSPFAQMTDGHGSHTCQIEFVYLDDEVFSYRSPEFTIDLGRDPLVVLGWAARLTNISAPRPGLYEFRLHCDGREVASELLLMKDPF